jgi:hypothetical protein
LSGSRHPSECITSPCAEGVREQSRKFNESFQYGTSVKAVHEYQAVATNTYETSATVEDQGQIRVAGVPFAPGTKVEVTINPIQKGAARPVAQAADRAERLLAALDKARNVEPIGAFDREELYDRRVLR